MTSTRLLAILTAATLTAALTGCGDDDQPTVANPPPVEQAPATTEEPAEPAPTTEAPSTKAPADPAPTTEAPGTEAPAEPSDDAPTSESTDEAPAGDLPTEPTAYGDLFVQAWVDQDQGLLEQLAGPDVLASMELWGGQGWSRGAVRQEAHGAVVIDYADEQNMQLALWVQEGITQDGEPHGVVSATVSEGAYPVPDTVEDYATAFVNSAGGDAEDREYLERLGTPEAAAEAQDWISDFIWGIPEVSAGEDGTVLVTFPGQDGVEMVLVVDRELAESASEDAVLSVRPEGGPQR